MILGVPRQHSLFLAACQLVHVLYYREMKTAREIEILFRRLRLYDQLGRRAEACPNNPEVNERALWA